MYFGAKEGISITGVTFEPTIQTDFMTSHFWEKSKRLLIVFYEYKSYEVRQKKELLETALPPSDEEPTGRKLMKYTA